MTSFGGWGFEDLRGFVDVGAAFVLFTVAGSLAASQVNVFMHSYQCFLY